MRLLRGVVPPLAVGVAAFVAARQAMLPGLAFWDTAELQTVGPVMGTAHPAGFPTYVLLGWFASVVLQPFGEPAFRMNLLAGLCLAVAAALTVDLVRVLTRSTLLGIAAGFGLALTPIAWSIGTHAEAHALHLVFVVLLLGLMVGWEEVVNERRGARDRKADRWLVAAAIVFGLSVGNHSLTLLLGLPVVLYVYHVDPGVFRDTRLTATCVFAFAITVVLVYLELPLRAGPFRAPLVYGRPETWDGFWYVVLGEQFRANVVNPFAELPAKVGSLVDRTILQFGILTPLIPLGFIATAIRRPSFAILTGTAVLITTFFAASYQNAEIGRYYLGPILMAWTWLAILGNAATARLATLLAREEERQRRPSTAPDLRRASFAGLAFVILVAPGLIAAPERYRDVDESRDLGAAQWVDAALEWMPQGAVLVSWWSYSTPLWYAQLIEGRRPDLIVIDDRTRLDEELGGITDVIDANLGARPVFVIRDDPLEAAQLAERYVLEYLDGFDARALTRVIGLRQAGS